jgi:hypothetical protein
LGNTRSNRRDDKPLKFLRYGSNKPTTLLQHTSTTLATNGEGCSTPLAVFRNFLCEEAGAALDPLRCWLLVQQMFQNAFERSLLKSTNAG